MLTDDEIEAMRATSASALPATCTVTRPSGSLTLDAETLTETPSAGTTVFTGACRVRTLNTQDMPAQVGDLHETLGRYIGTVPYDADGIQVDDFLTVTAGTDDELIGRPLRITDVRWSEWRVDRRLVLEDLQQP